MVRRARRRRGMSPPVAAAGAVALVGWVVLWSARPVLAWLVFGLAVVGLVAVPAWREVDRRARRRTRRTVRPARAAAPPRPPAPRRPAVRVEQRAAGPRAGGAGPTGPEFEQEVAALLRRDGCEAVEVSGGAGDRGADVTAISPEGHRVVVQCKAYRRQAVGDPELQKFLGTARQVHNAAIPLFVTTSRFTAPAQRLAKEHGIELVDGVRLASWRDRGWRLPGEPTEFVGEVTG